MRAVTYIKSSTPPQQSRQINLLHIAITHIEIDNPSQPKFWPSLHEHNKGPTVIKNIWKGIKIDRVIIQNEKEKLDECDNRLFQYKIIIIWGYNTRVRIWESRMRYPYCDLGIVPSTSASVDVNYSHYYLTAALHHNNCFSDFRQRYIIQTYIQTGALPIHGLQSEMLT